MQGLRLSICVNSENVTSLIAVLIILFVLCWQIALCFIPSILSIFVLPIVFLVLTKNFIRVQKPLLESIDKTAVEAVSHVFVVKLLGINDLIAEKQLQKMKKTFR